MTAYPFGGVQLDDTIVNDAATVLRAAATAINAEMTVPTHTTQIAPGLSVVYVQGGHVVALPAATAKVFVSDGNWPGRYTTGAYAVGHAIKDVRGGDAPNGWAHRLMPGDDTLAVGKSDVIALCADSAWSQHLATVDDWQAQWPPVPRRDELIVYP